MTIRVILTVLCLGTLSTAAYAQDDRGPVASGTVSATNMQSQTDVAFAGTFGYRFSRVLGMEIEGTVAPTLKAPAGNGSFTFSGGASSTGGGTTIASQVDSAPSLGTSDGRLAIFTTNARLDIPTVSTRLMPYFVAGGGVASIRRTASFIASGPLATMPGDVGTPQFPNAVVSSSTELAVTIGGGVDVRVLKQLAVEVDLRLFRLLGEDDRNVGRFGVGVRQRF